MTALRGIFGALDNIVYGLINLLYQLFFNVATNTSDLFANEMVMHFFQRVQLILGIFMMFQLAMSIIKGIMNPDTFTDSKTGFGNIIMRIMISLVMLTLLVPINIPSPKNEYERQINNNGILFGTLYSLQYRILDNNTVGRLVLGTTSGDFNYTKKNGSLTNLDSTSRTFTNSILKSFIRPNLWYSKSPVELNDCICRKDEDMANALQVYQEEDADYAALIGFAVEVQCPMEGTPRYMILRWKNTDMYGFVYDIFLSTVVGIIIVFFLISYIIDVAKRSVKLGVLRLIAPIPIISYMDAKGGKDTAFNAWVKLLIKTYLDLFIRLIVIYFILFTIRSLLTSSMYDKLMQQGVLGVCTFVAIVIGLLAFAKEAPKFLKEALGLKDAGFRIFGGLSDALGVAAVAGGTIGSLATNWRASREENKVLKEQGDKLHQSNLLNGFRNVGSALVGGIAGAYTGGKAYMADKSNVGTVMKAMNERNARRAAHSTLGGRIADTAYGMVTGQSLADRSSKIGEANKEAFSTLKNWKDSYKAEAIKNGGTFNYTLSNGQQLTGIRYSQVLAAVQAGADANGKFTIAGQKYDADLFGSDVMDKIADQQALSWKAGSVVAGGKTYADVVEQPSGKLYADYQRTIKAVNDAEIAVVRANGTTISGESLVKSYDDLGAAMGIANRRHQETQTDMRQIKRLANKQNKK